jgi:predicted dehydrogenase
MRESILTRRSVLRKAAAGLAAAQVRGRAQSAPANSRVTMGAIGVGARGTSVLRDFFKQADAQFVAMCDVNQDNLARAIHLANERNGNKDCKGYADFRELLARPDLDAVLIAAPHHWHVAMGVAAAKAGKDMYMEKPMALAMSWAWELEAAIERYGVIYQFGTQQHSDVRFKHAAELARSGKLGKVERALVLMPSNPQPNPPPPPAQPTPAFLDLDAWQGPALAAPYLGKPNTGTRSDRSFGSLSEWGPHMLDMVAWAGLHKPEAGLKVSGVGMWSSEGGPEDCPQHWSVDLDYGTGVKVEVRSQAMMPAYWRTRYYPNPQVERRFEHANILLGSEGWVYVDREGIRTSAPGLLEGMAAAQPEGSTFHHVRNFLDCVKSRKDPVMSIQPALEAELLTHLTYIAVETGEALTWDAKGRRFTESAIANRMLHRSMRSPWRA